MAAVVDCTAWFRGIVHGAEVLPFGGTHFRTRLRGARWVFGKESNDETVHFHREEPTKLVEPERSFDAIGSFCEPCCDFVGYWRERRGSGRAGKIVIERFEVFLQLEGRVELRSIDVSVLGTAMACHWANNWPTNLCERNQRRPRGHICTLRSGPNSPRRRHIVRSC